MKKMQELMRSLLDTKKLAVVFSVVVVLVAVLVIALIVRIVSSKKTPDTPTDSTTSTEVEDVLVKEAGYFEDSAYPVHASIEGSCLLIELDGSATPDLKWEIACSKEDMVTIEDKGDEDGGVRRFLILPKAEGYVDVVCTRSMAFGTQTYPVAEIWMSVLVGENPYAALEASLTDVQQTLAETGAADTDTPFLLVGSRIVFPNGGDWIVTQEEGTEDLFAIGEGTDGAVRYAEVYQKGQILFEETEDSAADGTEPEAVTIPGILLTSGSLGREIRVGMRMNADGQMILVTMEEE